MNRIGILGLLVAFGMGAIGLSSADAGGYGYGGRGYGHGYSSYGGHGYNGGGHSVYHGPPVHTDYAPHNQLHVSPWRGIHIDRHYDAVPHFAPRHFERVYHGRHW